MKTRGPPQSERRRSHAGCRALRDGIRSFPSGSSSPELTVGAVESALDDWDLPVSDLWAGVPPERRSHEGARARRVHRALHGGSICTELRDFSKTSGRLSAIHSLEDMAHPRAVLSAAGDDDYALSSVHVAVVRSKEIP